MKALWNLLRDMKCQLDLLNLLPTNIYYISTNIVQLFDFALRVKKLRIILVFFTFYDTFLCISTFPGKCELSSIQNSSKKRTFELNWIFLFSSSNTLIILNYLLSSEFFNQRASFPKSNAIWKMNTHNFLRHVKTWNLRTLIGVFD